MPDRTGLGWQCEAFGDYPLRGEPDRENSLKNIYFFALAFKEAAPKCAGPARTGRLDPVLAPALARLQTLEGFAFEKLVRSLHHEMSRKGLGDFELSELKLGYWNRPRDVAKSIEIDLIALDRPNRRIRFGSCKRADSAHESTAVARFEQHIQAFLQTREHAHLNDWRQERLLFSPEFSRERRIALGARGYACRDLRDFAALV